MHGVVSVLVSNLVMLGPVLLALRRWRLPFGTVTLLFTGFALALAVDRELAWTPALCSGTVMLAALSGLALHVLLFPPSAPASAGDPLTTRPHRGPDRSGTP